MKFENGVITLIQPLVAILVAQKNPEGHKHQLINPYLACILKIQETKTASKLEAFSDAIYNCISNLPDKNLVVHLAQSTTTNKHTHHYIFLLLSSTSSQGAFNINSKTIPYKLSPVYEGSLSPQHCRKEIFKQNSQKPECK